MIPAGLGFLLENIFRLAVFAVLVATSPITAAGLLADATASWFWRGLRWAITAAVLKPALALVLIIGVNMLSRPNGLSGLLAAAGVLLVALFCPFALYRLLAFVDPGTNAGMTARGFLNTSGLSGAPSGSGGAGGGSGSDGSSGGDGGEAAHAARFDAAGGGSGGSAGGAGTGGAGAGGTGAGAGGGGAATAGCRAPPQRHRRCGCRSGGGRPVRQPVRQPDDGRLRDRSPARRPRRRPHRRPRRGQ